MGARPGQQQLLGRPARRLGWPASLKILSVSANAGLAGDIPLAWLQGSALPELFLLDVGPAVLRRSLRSDAWRRAACLDPNLFSADKLQRTARLLPEFEQNVTSSQVIEVDGGAGGEEEGARGCTALL